MGDPFIVGSFRASLLAIALNLGQFFKTVKILCYDCVQQGHTGFALVTFQVIFQNDY